MPLSAGTRLGPYEILAPIGAGGMGEVYKARDKRLDRIVAIKLSKSEFSERFEREARSVAALNHPHICQLYDVGPNYLVMEYIEGTPPKGPLPVGQTLKYAAQICDALDAAHKKNITHRDLKPANILVTKAGVKLLDFGLAKSGPVIKADEATMTMALTGKGAILGTLLYMSPEQVNGQDAGPQSDIFSFGLVLYEMLTGKRAFESSTPASLIAAILERPAPSVSNVAPGVLDRVLKRCLEKDPENRWQSARDLKAALELVPADDAHDAPATSGKPDSPSRWRLLPWLMAGVAVLALLALAAAHFREPREATNVVRFALAAPENAPIYGGSIPAVSPDGRHVAFVAGTLGQLTLWVRDLDASAAHSLPGTEGAYEPFWSPDNRFLGFFASGKLKKIDIAGGPALTICDVGGARGGTWNKNGVIIFTPGLTSAVFRVSAAGGIPTSVTTLDQSSGEISHRFPWFLPDGHHFLYTARNSDPEKTAIVVADLDSGKRQPIIAANSNAAYALPGYLLFMRERTLMAQPFDTGKLQTAGDPVPVADQVDITASQTLSAFSVSQSTGQGGVLAYGSTVGDGNVQLTWFDRSGKALGNVGAPNYDFRDPRISPDGATVAVTRGDRETGFRNPWLYDLARGTASRFTNSQNNDYPVWSPDGQRIAFRFSRNGVSTLHWKPTTGAVEDEPLETTIPSPSSLDDWSSDGRYIIESIAVPKTALDLWVLPMFGDRKPFPYLQTAANEVAARLSPNGQWLAYSSDETKRYEVYVGSFPSPGTKWQVSANGGRSPVWSRDGKELYFIGLDGKMMVVEVKAGTKFEAGAPKVLFDTHLGVSPGFDVTKDGRFLIPTVVEQSGDAPMTVVINWQAGLKK